MKKATEEKIKQDKENLMKSNKNKSSKKKSDKCAFCKKRLSIGHPLWCDLNGCKWHNCCCRCFNKKLKKEMKDLTGFEKVNTV